MTSTLAPPKRDSFLASRQCWSFRHTLINYIAKNPLYSKSYQKLVQSCKYFFIINPVIVAEKLWFNDKEKFWVACMRTEAKRMANLSSKIWLTTTIENFAFEADTNLLSLITPYFVGRKRIRYIIVLSIPTKLEMKYC